MIYYIRYVPRLNSQFFSTFPIFERGGFVVCAEQFQIRFRVLISSQLFMQKFKSNTESCINK